MNVNGSCFLLADDEKYGQDLDDSSTDDHDAFWREKISLHSNSLVNMADNVKGDQDNPRDCEGCRGKLKCSAQLCGPSTTRNFVRIVSTYGRG